MVAERGCNVKSEKTRTWFLMEKVKNKKHER